MHHVSLNISVYDLEKTLYFEWDYIFIKIDLYVVFNIHISVIYANLYHTDVFATSVVDLV